MLKSSKIELLIVAVVMPGSIEKLPDDLPYFLLNIPASTRGALENASTDEKENIK